MFFFFLSLKKKVHCKANDILFLLNRCVQIERKNVTKMTCCVISVFTAVCFFVFGSRKIDENISINIKKNQKKNLKVLKSRKMKTYQTKKKHGEQ